MTKKQLVDFYAGGLMGIAIGCDDGDDFAHTSLAFMDLIRDDLTSKEYTHLLHLRDDILCGIACWGGNNE